MFSVLTKVYREVASWLFVRPSQFLLLLRDKSLYKQETYFPEFNGKRKSKGSVFLEQMGQILRYGKVNKYYFLYGFDVKSRAEQKEYIHSETFLHRRGELNIVLYHDYTCILRDKLIFSIFADGIGVETAKILFYTTGNKLYDYSKKKECEVLDLRRCEVNQLFCKPLDGEGGKGVFVVDIREDGFWVDGKLVSEQTLLMMLTKCRYLVQRFIVQHEEMRKLHPQSINSIRLVTVRGLKDEKIHIMPSIMRVGTGDSKVDNTSQGGLAIGIEMETGRLRKYGYYKPQFGSKIEVHPDSHIRFDGFQIPYFEEVKKQAVYFHSMLPQIHSVGWDVVVGERGPIFIEGNDNWEINGPQSCNRGLKKEFEEYFYK